MKSKCIDCVHNVIEIFDFVSSTDCEHQDECMAGYGTERLKFEPKEKGTTEHPKYDE